MLSVTCKPHLLSVIMLNVIILSVVMLSVVAPSELPFISFIENCAICLAPLLGLGFYISSRTIISS
jgi:hypothetical protein